MALTTRTLIKQILSLIGTPEFSGETLFRILEKMMQALDDLNAAVARCKSRILLFRRRDRDRADPNPAHRHRVGYG